MVVLSKSLTIRRTHGQSYHKNCIQGIHDKYVEKQDVLTFTRLFNYAQLKRLTNLRSVSENVSRKKTVQRQVGLKVSVNPSFQESLVIYHLRYSKLSCII